MNDWDQLKIPLGGGVLKVELFCIKVFLTK